MEWLEALVLGLVQGLTEFLPISSDGHLSITQEGFAWLTGRRHSAAENLFFDVMLHLGTLAAILLYYRAVIGTGLKGLRGSEEVAPEYRRSALIRTGLLAFLATLPLVPDALFLKKWLEQAFDSPAAAGFGFLITAAVLALTARLRGGEKGPGEMAWYDALLIGLAQMFAPLPGVSRSGLTVASALALGLSRSWAVGFSLLIAVPAILGAAAFEFRKVDPSSLDADRVARTVAATVLAGVVGFGAIIWLVKIVRSGRLWYFSVYLVVLATVVLALTYSGAGRGRGEGSGAGGSRDARGAKALDRPVRVGVAGTGPGRDAGRPLVGLDRPHAAGARPGPPDPRGGDGGRAPAPGLVLGRPLAIGR
jgi:undecaprenyl-diphosphatase